MPSIQPWQPAQGIAVMALFYLEFYLIGEIETQRPPVQNWVLKGATSKIERNMPFLQGHEVIGERKMALNWKRVGLVQV